jgi:hypothetical protein
MSTIFLEPTTKPEQTLNEFIIKFTIEKELNDSISFLDLTIHREEENLLLSIYRKPTQTDIIIPNDSFHQYEHKFSSSNYLLNRAHNYPVTKGAKETELNTIGAILLSSQYNTNQINKHPVPQKQNAHTDSQQQKTKWATFRHSRKEAWKITKLFRDTQIKIAFRTQNTIQNISESHS